MITSVVFNGAVAIMSYECLKLETICSFIEPDSGRVTKSLVTRQSNDDKRSEY